MHVGLIVDGVRRWSRREGVELTHGYRKAFERVDAIIRDLFDSDVDTISLYLLSKDNLKRTERDLDAVFTATAGFLSSEMHRIADDYAVSFGLAGDLNMVPTAYGLAVQGLLGRIVPDNKKAKRIYLLVAYSPAEELIANWKPGLVTMDLLVAELWVPQRVDLVIRTGGAALLSDFLPLQCGYARIWWSPLSIAELRWEHIQEEVATTMNTEALRGR